MLGVKEIDILKALVEEEISSSSTTPDKSTSVLVDNYRHTLSGIVKKLHGMQGDCANGLSKRPVLSYGYRD